MPLKLTATPEELDGGFVQALTSFATKPTSLEEQVAATTEVLEGARAASVKEGAEAVAKVGAKTPAKAPAKVAQPSAPADDEEDRDDNAVSDGSSAGGSEAKADAPAGGVTVPDLFGG